MRGYTLAKDQYVERLRKIEGQVRGLQRMVEDDRYCIDILTQISSVRRALESVALGLMDQHLRHCVMEAAEHGAKDREDKLNEAVSAVERLVRG